MWAIISAVGVSENSLGVLFTMYCLLKYRTGVDF